LDISYPLDESFVTARSLLDRRDVRAVLFIDQAFALARAKKALSVRGAGYVTHDEDVYGICNGIRDLLSWNSEGSPPVGTVRSPHFLQNLSDLAERDEHGLLRLTPREYAVMVRIAQGNSVRQTANLLGLAESTVDNHKRQVMRKLNVRKASQLTRIAIVSGCVC
jgi:DNA-binding NarL/FixJ family response regulator